MIRSARRADRRVLFVGALGLVSAILVAYSGVVDHAFVGFDDDEYVAENPIVLEGLTWAGVTWAFTTGHAANWHPLTWLSHMLDVTLFGVDPGSMALENVGLHVCTSLLLLWLLFEMTNSAPSALIATALFALHPLRVESVAWIAERKDVLCAFFVVATLLAWHRQVARPGPARYALALVLFAAALMAKPVAVTLPFVLLLFDFWPYARIGASTSACAVRLGRVVGEKLPFFALTALSIGITLVVQAEGGAMDGLFVPFSARVANGLVSYAAYLASTCWPMDLAVFYPWSPELREPEMYGALWQQPRVVAATGLLLALSAIAWRERVRRPWLGVGWCFFVGTLVPMIGLVKVGNQAMADRYTYVPSMGLAMIVAAALAGIVRPPIRRGIVASGLVCAALLGVATHRQVATWRDAESLYRHALEATRDNHLAHFNLGTLLLKQDPTRLEEARSLLEAAYALVPEHAGVRLNLGAALWLQGKTREATPHFEAAVRLRPANAEARLSLGAARFEQGRVDAAIAHFEQAALLAPEDARPHANLGHVFLMSGRAAEAESSFLRASELLPSDSSIRSGIKAARSALAESKSRREGDRFD